MEIRNIYFRLRFGLVNTTNAYLRLKIRVLQGGIFSLKLNSLHKI